MKIKILESKQDSFKRMKKRYKDTLSFIGVSSLQKPFEGQTHKCSAILVV